MQRVAPAPSINGADYIADDERFERIITLYLVHTNWQYIEATENIRKNTLRSAIMLDKAKKQIFFDRIKAGCTELAIESLPAAIRGIESVLQLDAGADDNGRLVLAGVKALGDIITKLQPPQKANSPAEDDIDRIYNNVINGE